MQIVNSIGRRGATIKVAAGHYVDVLNPAPETIDIKSIAAALSKICRFGGHCPEFYSVAEHCVLATSLAASDGASQAELVAILLHDAAEAYVGDMVKPLKVLLTAYQDVEVRMETAIATAFGVSFVEHHPKIKEYDFIMLKAEKAAFWPNDIADWYGLDDVEARDIIIKCWGPDLAASIFIDCAISLHIKGANGY